jgi:CelD/BcsL family acetyltransferase involved in cellulose biosynthesis
MSQLASKSRGSWGFVVAEGREELSTSLIQDPSEFDGLRASWDALAVAVRSPFGCPAWAEAWWRHLAPNRARLAVVAVHAGDELVGLAPFYSTHRFGVTELRLLSGGLASRLGILAVSGQEREVATAIAEALANLDPSPDVFRWEAIDADAQWPELLSSGWPGDESHRLQDQGERSAPVIYLGQESYEEWLAGKDREFRRKIRRRRRNIEAEGATFRCANLATLSRDLESFARLHFARWEGRGGSTIPAGAVPMLQEVGETLIEAGRFRLWLIDGPDGEAISASVLLAAGGVVASWNKGFDERWSRYAPGVLTAQAAIADAFERGEDVFDLGGGKTDYKARLADEDQPVAWCMSYPPGLRHPLTVLEKLPEHVARRGSFGLRRWLGQERLNRLRGLLRG